MPSIVKLLYVYLFIVIITAPSNHTHALDKSLCTAMHHQLMLYLKKCRQAIKYSSSFLLHQKVTLLNGSDVVVFTYPAYIIAFGIVLYIISVTSIIATRSYPNHLLYLSQLLLTLSGDIELNPGPILFSLNINSLRNKIVQLHAELADEVNIIALTETKIDNTIPDANVLVPGFNQIFRKDLTINSGGVCLQLKNEIIGTRMLELEQPDLELLWVKLTYGHSSYIVGVCYRNPAHPVSYWEKLLENLANAAAIHGTHRLIIVGDLNDNLLRQPCHLSEVIDSLNMVQLVTDPTRYTPQSQTLLDPIIVGQQSRFRNVSVLSQGLSDHCAVVVEILSDVPKTMYKRKIWLYNKANWDAIKRDANAANFPALIDQHKQTDLETLVKIFNATVISICKKYIPCTIVKQSTNDKPWVTAELKCEIKQRNKYFQDAKRSGSYLLFEKFKTQRNKVNKLVRKAKEEYTTTLTNKLVDSKKDKDWWKLVKSVSGLNNNSSIPALNENGSAVTDPKAKAQILNNYFAEICTVDESNIPNIGEVEPIATDTLTSIEITEQEVNDQINCLNIHKAIGPDEISPRVIKFLKTELSSALAMLFNRSLNEATFPESWKKANITPIFKKGDRNNHTNYRPISLLSTVSKLFEKVVYKHIYNHIRHYISPNQSGFLPNHSAVTQLLEINHNILKDLDDGKEIFILFCDVAKAFDKTSHKGILTKLHQYGIRDQLRNWFSSYLANRQQRVVLDGQSSDWKPVRAGVPQGSILGPLLFILYINDITISEGTRLFADDATHAVSSHHLELETPSIQRDINNISSWTDTWAISHNETKTEHMLISRRNQPSVVNCHLKNTPITAVNSHKHLGLTFSNNATWTKHINIIVSDANRKLGILQNLKYKVDGQSLLILYKSFVRSTLEYGDVVWDGLPQVLSDKLERVQINAMRLISGLTISAPIRNLYDETGLLPLSKRRKLNRLVLFYKIRNGLAPAYLQNLIPASANERHNYNTRNASLITPILTRTTSFTNSFFPATVRDWNLLDNSIKEKNTVDSFKKSLLLNPEFHTNPPPSWYNVGPRHLNIIVARIRNNCSALASHLHENHVLENPYCPFCNNIPETPDHFFLNCAKHTHARHALSANTMHITLLHDLTLNAQLLTKGNTLLSASENASIIKSAQSFIAQTNRFNNT